MKIIHCADVHLDSPMNRLETSEKKKERKAELITAFTQIVNYAKKENVRAVIIAGDLFDQGKVSVTAKKTVLSLIKDSAGIDFYYLRGNHDSSNAFCDSDSIPSNLFMFGDDWTSYDLGENVFLTGAELTETNTAVLSSRLNLDHSRFNIVTLHGQESLASPKDNAQVVNIKEYRNRNIDYMALGHVHSYKYEKLDGRGFYCYPGCLEARGFDETGEHGFVLLDIDGENMSFTAKLISNPIRMPHVLPVNISGALDSSDIMKKIDEELAKAAFPQKDLVKVELTGEVDFQCDKNLAVIEKKYAGSFYDFKLKDLSVFRVDYEKFRLDESLKGESIRTVEQEQNLSDKEKAEIIRIGIRALMGEEVE